MTIHLGSVPAGSTLYIPFATYGAAGGSITMSGFALGDILIYKNGSTTQRASTSGFTLLDTDGIDFDGVTGLHGFSVDLSDNTTAGFYAAGSFYWVVVSTITVDGQTITAIPATFRIVAAENVAGTPAVDATLVAGTAPETSTTVAGAVWNVDMTSHQTQGTAGQVLGDSVADTDSIWSLCNTNLDAPVSTGGLSTSDVQTSAEAAIDAKLGTISSTVWGYVMDGSRTAVNYVKLIGAACAGKSTKTGNTRRYRNLDDTVNAITATTNSDGERTTITYDLT